MSKTTELRRKATEAVRAHRWEKAVELYEKLCKLDASNASYRNELGDLHLKLSDTSAAIEAFLAAASLYRSVGLTNNAIAVHKKVLRHEPNQLDSLWALGEIRLEAGHEADTVTSFLDFLSRASQVPDHARSIFVKRCQTLVERMGDDLQVLSRLEKIFAELGLERDHATVLVAKASLAHEEGEFDVRDKYVEHAREAFEALDALSEYQALRRRIEGVEEPAVAVARTEEARSQDGLAADVATGVPEVEIDPEVDFSDLEDAIGLDVLPPTGRGDGIDLGFDFDEDALSGAAERVSGGVSPAGSASPEVEMPAGEPAAAEPRAEDSPWTDEPDPAPVVDLLESILADSSLDDRVDADGQVDTIKREMEGQIGGHVDPSDHAGQYDLGVVYMDMGLYEQAVGAFARAAEGAEERLKALEMQGTCLLRLERVEEAMAVFESGLQVGGHPGRAYLGLQFGVGACHEAARRFEAALAAFDRVAQLDPHFLDVGERTGRLRAALSAS